MKWVIVNFTGRRPNWGCQATSWELHKFVSELASDFEVSGIDTVPLMPAHALDHLVQRVHGDWLYTLYSCASPRKSDLLYLEWLTKLRFGPLADRVKYSDVVFFQGEGTIGPEEHLRGLRLFALPLLAKRLWNKPVFSLNQSVYAAKTEHYAVLANIFSSFDGVVLREAKSYAQCKAIGLDKAFFCPDMAFRTPVGTSTRIPALGKSRYFCISGSAALEFLDPVQFIGTIKRISESHGLLPVFLYSKIKDHSLVRIAASVEPSMRFVEVSNTQCPDFMQLRSVLAGAEFVLGGRYHTAITGLTQLVPTILLPGNSHKSEGIGDILDIKMPVLAMDDEAGIQEAANEIMLRRDAISKSIASGLIKTGTQFDALKHLLHDAISQSMLGKAVAISEVHSILLMPHVLAASENSIHQDIYRAKNLRRTKTHCKTSKGFGLFQSANISKILANTKAMLSLASNRKVFDAHGNMPPKLEIK